MTELANQRCPEDWGGGQHGLPPFAVKFQLPTALFFQSLHASSESSLT